MEREQEHVTIESRAIENLQIMQFLLLDPRTKYRLSQKPVYFSNSRFKKPWGTLKLTDQGLYFKTQDSGDNIVWAEVTDALIEKQVGDTKRVVRNLSNLSITEIERKVFQ